MTPRNYRSIIKIGGQPILPPMINDCERPLLRRYKEEAMKVEAEIAEKARKAEEDKAYQEALAQEALVQEALAQEALAQEAEALNGSMMSSIDTVQVMNFIRQALDGSSHLEEVQNLQQAIFDELLKYGEVSPQMRRVDSMDTLHNIDDFSTAAESSRDVSPTKSLHSERSPPKVDKNVSGKSDKTDSLGLERSPSSAGDLVGPRLSLSYPSTPLVETGHDQSLPGPSHEGRRETPQLIRRNSYTLESPSPSVLEYLKSLQIDEVETLPPDKTAKRNLNQLWSEVLSATSMDTNLTPMNYSAASWKSDTEPSFIDNASVIQNNKSYTKFNRSHLDQDQLNCNIAPITTNNCKKEDLHENNNGPPSVERAAAKIQAGVRGYLTRRLLKTARVVELKNAIRDSLITALQMHTEATVSKAELELHRQLTRQIESLCDEWHQIFFEYTPQERMRIIQVDRTKAKNPKPKKPFFLRKSRSRVSMESSVTSLTNSTSSIASRPKSLPLMKPRHASTANFKAWK